MRAPAFWYFATEGEARDAELRLHGSAVYVHGEREPHRVLRAYAEGASRWLVLEGFDEPVNAINTAFEPRLAPADLRAGERVRDCYTELAYEVVETNNRHGLGRLRNLKTRAVEEWNARACHRFVPCHDAAPSAASQPALF
jgi:hypothetical protein